MIEIPYKFVLDLINVATLVILMVIKINYTQQFKNFTQLFWSDDFIHLDIKEQKKMFLFKGILLILTSVHFAFFVSSLLFTLKLNWLEAYWTNVYLYASVFFLFILVKSIIIHFLGYVFQLENHSKYLVKFKFNKSIYWFFIFFIGQLLMHYSPFETIHVALLIAVLGGLYLLVSAIKFQLRFQNEIIRHWYYFILYLCTLEIAPYILLYKVVSDSLN